MSLTRRNTKQTIEREAFLQLLKQCYLGGALAEATLRIEDGIGVMELIDITNTITIHSSIKLAGEDVNCELGLGDLDLIIKFLSSLEDEELLFDIKKMGWMRLSTKKGNRSLSYLLSKTDLIVTNVEKDYRSMFKKLKKKMEEEIELEEGTIRDLLSYINMIKEKGLTLRMNEGILSIVYGNPNEHRFKVILDKHFSGNDDFDIKLNGEFIAKILNVIEYEEGEKPLLAFADSELPVMIKGKNTTYFITPIAED